MKLERLQRLVEASPTTKPIRSKTAEYVELNYSDLVKAIERRFKTSIPAFGYGDELHVFGGVKPMKTINGVSMKKILADEELGEEAFEEFVQASRTSLSDIEFLTSVALAAGLLTGSNFIVHIDYGRGR